MADESYWTYRPATPTPTFEEFAATGMKGTESEWYALSPGMRREIIRSFNKRKESK